MASIEVINNIIQLEKSDDGIFVRLGPILSGEVPIFEMHDQTMRDTIKKLFFIKDYRMYHDAVDKRFFINDYPSPLYSLPPKTAEKLAALPAGTTLASDGRLITLRLPPGSSDQSTNDAVEVIKAIAQKAQRKLALIGEVLGAKKQARTSWDQCPEPQYMIRATTVTIDVYAIWRGPVVLQTQNINSVSKGILSVKNKVFVPHSGDEKQLMKEAEEAGCQEFAAVFGSATSFYSSMNDHYLKVNFFLDPSLDMLQAAVEMLTRLATPKSEPFR
jgi:hypothetical protein